LCLAQPVTRHDVEMASRLDEIQWPVTTERLLLRRASDTDLDAIWSIRSTPKTSDWLTVAADDRAGFEADLLAPERFERTIVLVLDDVVIGDATISIQDAWSQAEVRDRARGVEAELGWVLDPAHGGHGYATEAVRGLLRLCFDVLGLRRVVANCFADNTASWRLMERVGMRRELHTIADSLHRSGQWLDGLGYAMLADEWRTPPADAAGDG